MISAKDLAFAILDLVEKKEASIQRLFEAMEILADVADGILEEMEE